MARRLLPALRGLGGVQGKSLPMRGAAVEAPETKRVYLGGGYSSTTVLGQEGRADYWDMDTVITEAYERSVWIYRCVELMTDEESSLPLHAARKAGTGEQEVLADHPLYRLLNEGRGKANPLEKGPAFRKRIGAQLLLSKRGVFIEKTRDRAGRLSRLDLLHPSRTRPMPSSNGDYLDYFEYVRQDGEVRELSPDRVLWIRKPHPTDLFSGTTPLEAAGLSIDLDHLSRLWNSSFIKNDARPGGILAVDTESLLDAEADRIERKFAPGAHTAGELAVIATGPGGMNYVDTSTKPRDMAYKELAAMSKEEILAAMGIAPTMLGSSSGRNLEHAEHDEFLFWTGPMKPFLKLISDAFADEFEDGFQLKHDTSSVDVLELRDRKARQEAREEVNQGLRSIDEYRPLANMRPLDVAHTRALWISPAKAPVPGRPEDAAALGLAVADPNAPGGMAPGTPGGLGPGGEPMGPDGQPVAPDGAAGGRTAAEVVAAAMGGDEAPLDPTLDPQASAAGAPDTDLAAAPVAGEEGWAPIGPATLAVARARGAVNEGVTPGAAAAAVSAARATGADEAAGAGPAAAAVAAARGPGLLEGVEKKGCRASLGRSPNSNWVEEAGGLPPYFREVARAIERESGKPLSSAIPMAISTIGRWALGGDDVHPDTIAKSAAAMAEWAALKAKNRAPEVKVVETSGGGDPAPEHVDDGGAQETQRAELAIAAALDALLARQQQVVIARLQGPTARRGTALWTPAAGEEPIPPEEQAPLDVARVVQPERWTQEAVDTITPIAQTASVEAGAAVLAGLVGAGLMTAPVMPLVQVAGIAGAGVTIAAVEVAREIVAAFLGGLVDTLTGITGSGPVDEGVDGLVERIRGYYADRSPGLSSGIAEQVAVGVVNGSREQVMAGLGIEGIRGGVPRIDRTWVTRGDALVRDAHRRLQGVELPVGVPFEVDGSTLMYPRDPLAPPRLTINCRCRCRYRIAGGQSLVPAPRF